MTAALNETFITRGSSDPSVIVADGHGISITVRKGELVIKDGMCGRGRTRTVARKDRHVRRIVVLGHTGHISIDAMQWIHGVSVTPAGRRRTDPISLVVVSPVGELINTSVQSFDDTKLHRAQACLRDTPVALDVTKYLLSEKFRGHERVIEAWDAAPWLKRLDSCTDQRECRQVESQEAKEYFESWRLLELKFDVAAPYHWRIFDSRVSELNQTANTKQGHKRNATNPTNAMLNYTYEVAKAETALACYVEGLDPTLGVCHTDEHPRAMTLDLVEAVRPNVEAYVLDLINSRMFRRRDFIEKDTGVVRIQRPLTSELSEQRLNFYRAVSPHVEEVRKMINATVSGRRRADATRLTGTNKRKAWEKRQGVTEK